MLIKRICGLSIVNIIFFFITSCMEKQVQTSTTPVPNETITPVPETIAPTPEPVLKKVGISFPSSTIRRWKDEGEYIKQLLEEAGYYVNLQYNDYDFDKERLNVENLIQKGCDLLIIRPIDLLSARIELQEAKNANIPVIAYGFPFFGSDAISYLIEVDREKICPLQLEYIERALGLPEADGPFYIEMFNNFSEDINSKIYSENALRAFQKYIDSGKIIVKSGRIRQEQTFSWGKTEEDQKEVKDLFSACNYGPDGTRLDAVWCYSDYQAGIVTQELLARGYTPDNFPIITGANCSIESVKNIIAGTQSMSVHTDVRALPEETVEMVINILEGNPVETHEIRDFIGYDGNYPDIIVISSSCHGPVPL